MRPSTGLRLRLFGLAQVDSGRSCPDAGSMHGMLSARAIGAANLRLRLRVSQWQVFCERFY